MVRLQHYQGCSTRTRVGVERSPNYAAPSGALVFALLNAFLVRSVSRRESPPTPRQCERRSKDSYLCPSDTQPDLVRVGVSPHRNECAAHCPHPQVEPTRQSPPKSTGSHPWPAQTCPYFPCRLNRYCRTISLGSEAFSAPLWGAAFSSGRSARKPTIFIGIFVPPWGLAFATAVAHRKPYKRLTVPPVGGDVFERKLRRA